MGADLYYERKIADIVLNIVLDSLFLLRYKEYGLWISAGFDVWCFIVKS